MGAVAATLSLASKNTWDATVASPMGPLRWKDKGSEGTGLQRACLAPIRTCISEDIKAPEGLAHCGGRSVIETQSIEGSHL